MLVSGIKVSGIEIVCCWRSSFPFLTKKSSPLDWYVSNGWPPCYAVACSMIGRGNWYWKHTGICPKSTWTVLAWGSNFSVKHGVQYWLGSSKCTCIYVAVDSKNEVDIALRVTRCTVCMAGLYRSKLTKCRSTILLLMLTGQGIWQGLVTCVM